ncbi:MAG: DUF3341 domain-containing protein [Bacteroidetes bacterium]|nr:DUF3341 domain-containing protein [Bacteroidales bacterium]MBU1008512.1 DUF3341 domain-containing protein [Bacteroidota bacterium]
MNKYITAYYNDEEDLLKGIKQLKSKGIDVADVMTPFPVHGLDKALGFRRSRLTRVAFIGGAIGGLTGFLFQAWVFTKAYPLNFGGKPFFAVPSFIPVTFEMTVLFAAFSMVIAFFIRSNIGPGAKTIIHDERSTDDRFLLVVDIQEDEEVKQVEKALAEAGALGIQFKA